MSIIEGRLRDLFQRTPEAVRFATFIQPAKYIERGPEDEGWLPPMAVFVVTSPNPRNRQFSVVTHATVLLAAFMEAEDERRHFVMTKPDPALVIFTTALKTHLETLTNMTELMN